MKLSWLICVMLLMALPASAQTPAPAKPLTPLEQTLIANEHGLIEAKKKDDATFFKRTLAEDFTLVGVDGKLKQRHDAVDEIGDSTLLELTPYDIRVVPVDDHSAIVSYDAIVRTAPSESEGPPPRYQHFSSVWVQQDDHWKLKFHQATAAHWGDW